MTHNREFRQKKGKKKTEWFTWDTIRSGCFPQPTDNRWGGGISPMWKEEEDRSLQALLCLASPLLTRGLKPKMGSNVSDFFDDAGGKRGPPPTTNTKISPFDAPRKRSISAKLGRPAPTQNKWLTEVCNFR